MEKKQVTIVNSPRNWSLRAYREGEEAIKAKFMNIQTIQVERLTKWYNLFTLIKQHGILSFTWLAFRYILRYTLRIDWQRTILLERSLSESIQEVVPKIQVKIQQATEDDLPKFKEIVDEDKYDRFKQRLNNGRICFMALDGKKVVAFAWISLEDEYEPNSQVEVKLNDYESYLFDDYVNPEYRNNRLQSALITMRLMYLHAQIDNKVMVLIGEKNTYSLKAYASVGFRPQRSIDLFTIFGLKFHRWQSITGPLRYINGG